MTKTQTIYCPNCGAVATKTVIDNSIRRTSCESCDYLLVQHHQTGKVIEAYGVGFNSYSTVEPVTV